MRVPNSRKTQTHSLNLGKRRLVLIISWEGCSSVFAESAQSVSWLEDTSVASFPSKRGTFFEQMRVPNSRTTQTHSSNLRKRRLVLIVSREGCSSVFAESAWSVSWLEDTNVAGFPSRRGTFFEQMRVPNSRTTQTHSSNLGKRRLVLIISREGCSSVFAESAQSVLWLEDTNVAGFPSRRGTFFEQMRVPNSRKTQTHSLNLRKRRLVLIISWEGCSSVFAESARSATSQTQLRELQARDLHYY